MIRIRTSTALVVPALLAAGLVPAPAASAAPGNLLRNPGFEKSLTSNAWKGQDCCVTTSDPHKGDWIAWMGGNGTPHTDTIRQKVSIPRAAGATLTFWVKISTEEGTGSPDDTFRARVTTAGGVTRTVRALSSADATGTYVKYAADVSRYTGKTVTISFVAVEDQDLRTDFQLDTTSLKTT